jgi:hypothetical protein
VTNSVQKLWANRLRHMAVIADHVMKHLAVDKEDVEQLQLTLGHLYDKQDQVHRLLETLPAEALITAAPTLTT